MGAALELSPEASRDLAGLAERTGRSVDALLEEAIERYLADEREILEGIERGIADADAGRTVDHDAVVAWVESWGTEDELPRPK